MDHVERTDALESEVERFANVMSAMSRDEQISTCPGWSVVDLAEHLGLIHRWAEELVRLRSPERIDRVRSVPDFETVSPDWIRAGGQRLVATLRSADPDDVMWAWGFDQHVRFWSRRQLHETLVHRMDLELAADVDPSVDGKIAADAIDEYLANVESVGNRSPELSLLRGHGERLVFRTSDSPALWSIALGEERFTVSKSADNPAAEIVGAAVPMLLVVMRRRGVTEADVDVSGDRQLLDFWLAHSAFD